jgi:hypothetical protein
MEIASPVPNFHPFDTGQFWLLAIPGLALLALMMRVNMKYGMLTDLERPADLDGTEFSGDEAIERAVLVRLDVEQKVGAERWKTEQAQYSILNHLQLAGDEPVSDLLKGTGDRIVIKQFDYGLGDPRIAERKLALLEQISDKLVVFIECSVDPLYIMTEQQNDQTVAAGPATVPLDRWAAVLQRYTLIRSSRPKPPCSLPPSKSPAEFAIEQETWPTDRLSQIGNLLGSHRQVRGNRDMRHNEVVETILDLAEAQYRRIWTTCSTDEKMLLYRISRGGFVNHAAERTLQGLIQRGLVLIDPSCRIMNESFRRFILTAERPETFAKWQAEAGDSPWARLRLPLGLAITAVALFFVTTQRELFNQTAAVLAAATASAPALFRLIGLAGESRRDSSEK